MAMSEVRRYIRIYRMDGYWRLNEGDDVEVFPSQDDAEKYAKNLAKLLVEKISNVVAEILLYDYEGYVFRRELYRK